MPSSLTEAMARIRGEYPAKEPERIAAMLRECAKIHKELPLAVVELADGDPAELERLAGHARFVDSRDVLWWHQEDRDRGRNPAMSARIEAARAKLADKLERDVQSALAWADAEGWPRDGYASRDEFAQAVVDAVHVNPAGELARRFEAWRQRPAGPE